MTLQVCHVRYRHLFPPTQAPFNVETPLQCAKLIGMEHFWLGPITQTVLVCSAWHCTTLSAHVCRRFSQEVGSRWSPPHDEKK